MNGIGTCRIVSIGGAAAGGLLLWILLALGERGWFSSLLIAALIAGAAAALLLALVCRGQETEADGHDAPADHAEPRKVDVAEPMPGVAADTGGRHAESEKAEAPEKVNDTAVLEDNADEGETVSEPAEDAPRTQAPGRKTGGAGAAETDDMPDGVAAELRQKPELLDAPRGTADDLKRLRGVGPKLEEQLNRLGIWHLGQIAGWTEAEAAWVDDHLEGFKGRIQRDDWIGQARMLKDESA